MNTVLILISAHAEHHAHHTPVTRYLQENSFAYQKGVQFFCLLKTGYYGLSLLEVMFRWFHMSCAKLQDVLISSGSLVCLMQNTCVCHCPWYSSFRCLTPICGILYTLPFFWYSVLIFLQVMSVIKFIWKGMVFPTSAWPLFETTVSFQLKMLQNWDTSGNLQTSSMYQMSTTR